MTRATRPFPTGIADKMADVRLDRRKAGLRRVPSPHLTGCANGVLLVEDGGEAFRVLLGDATQGYCQVVYASL